MAKGWTTPTQLALAPVSPQKDTLEMENAMVLQISAQLSEDSICIFSFKIKPIMSQMIFIFPDL